MLQHTLDYNHYYQLIIYKLSMTFTDVLRIFGLHTRCAQISKSILYKNSKGFNRTHFGLNRLTIFLENSQTVPIEEACK